MTYRCEKCKDKGYIRYPYRDVEDYDGDGLPIYVISYINKKCEKCSNKETVK